VLLPPGLTLGRLNGLGNRNEIVLKTMNVNSSTENNKSTGDDDNDEGKYYCHTTHATEFESQTLNRSFYTPKQ